MIKRVVSLLLAILMTVSVLPGTAFAAVGNLLGNSPVENQALLEQLEDLTGQDSEMLWTLLEQYGLLDEDGNLVTDKTVQLDGVEYTLEQLESMLSDPATDLGKVAEVDGVPIALGDLKTIIAIEQELRRIQQTYFSGRPFEDEALENLNDLMSQMEATGITLQSEGTLDKPISYLADKVVDVSGFRVLKLPVESDSVSAAERNIISTNFWMHTAPTGEAVSVDVSYDPGLLGDFVEKVEVALGSSVETLTADDPTATLRYETQGSGGSSSRTETQIKVQVYTKLHNEGLPPYVFGDLAGAVTFSNPTGGIVFQDGDSYRQQHTLLVVKPVDTSGLAPSVELDESSFDQAGGTSVYFSFGDAEKIAQVDALRKLLQDVKGEEVTETNAVRYQLTGNFAQENNKTQGMSMRYANNMRYCTFYPKEINDKMEGAWKDWWSQVWDYSIYPEWNVDTKTNGVWLHQGSEMPFSLVGWSATADRAIPEQFYLTEAFETNFPSRVKTMVKGATLELVDDKTSPKLEEITAPKGIYVPGQRIPVTLTFDELVKVADDTTITINGKDYTAEELGLNTAGNRLMLWYPVQAVDNTGLTISFGDGTDAGVSDIFGNPVEISGEEIPDVTLESTLMRDAVTNMEAVCDTKKDTLTVNVTLTEEEAYEQYYTSYHKPASGEQQELPFRALVCDTEGKLLTTLPIYVQEDELGNTHYASNAYDIPKSMGAATNYEVMLQANEGTRDDPVWVNLNWRTDSASSGYIVLVTRVYVSTDQSESGGYYVIDKSEPDTWPTMEAKLYTGTSDLPTYRSGKWSSSDDTVATIDEAGKVTPQGEGYVQFTFTADNGTPDDTSDDVSGTSGIYQVIPGNMPALHFSGTATVRQYGAATLNWGSNLADKAEEDFNYTIDLFEGNFATNDALAGQTPVKTYTVDKNTSSIQIPEGVLSKIGGSDTPAYTVRISAPNPKPEVVQGTTITSLTWITVQANPVTARLIRPDQQAYADRKTSSMDIEWELKGLAPGQSGTLRVLCVKDDETSETVLERTVTTETGSVVLDFPSVTGLRNLYQVMLSVDNGPDEAPSTDSYPVYVYNSDEMQIVNSAGKAITTLDLSNTSKVHNISDSSTMTTEEILNMRQDLGLMDYVSISGDDWNAFKDRIRWSGSNDIVSINYKQGGLYENIKNFAFDSYLPETIMGLSSVQEGTSFVTATHAATGMSDTVTVNVSTLRDKFYLFQFTPAVTTTVRYTNGNGSAKTLTTNKDGVLALYDPFGIASNVLLSSEVTKNGTTTEYTGTILQTDLLSGERDATKLQLYPLNTFRLREAAKAELTLVKPDGSPLANTDVTIRGGVYKNGRYCQNAGLGTSRDSIGAAGQDQKDTTFRTNADGTLTIYFDATQFDNQSTPLKPSDEISYSLEIKDIANDAYYPVLKTISANVSPLLEMRTASGVVVLETVPDDEKNKPFVAEQTVDYNLESGQLVDVRKSTGYVGPNSTFPEAKLTTTMLLWGEELDNDCVLDLVDENGYCIPNLEPANVTRPFASIPVVSVDMTLSEDTLGWFEQGTDMGIKTRLSKWSDADNAMILVQERTLPFRLIDLTNVPQANEDANVTGILTTMSEASMLKNAQDAFLDDSTNGIVKTLAGSLLNLTGGINGSEFKMLITPSEDPTVFNALIWAGYDGLELTDKDYSEDGVAISSSVFSSNLEMGLPSKSSVSKMADGSYIPTSVSRRHQVSVESTGADFDLQLEGYYEAEIRYDKKSGSWKVYTKGGGFTAGAGVGYGFDVNTMAGPVPLTGSFNVGGAVQLSFQTAARYSQAGDGELSAVNDYLTNLRLNAYVNAFGGVGYDYAIVALKIGLFGSLAVDSQNRFLTRAVGSDLQGQALGLDSEVGIKFVAQVLAFSYDTVLVSGKFSDSWKYHDWDAIDEYWNSATTGLSTQALQSAAANSGLQVASVSATLQSRDYLEQYARTWGEPRARIALYSLDKPNGLSNLQSNANPASYPEITDDGQVLVYIDDGYDAQDNPTPSIYDSRVHYSTLGDSGYETSKAIADPDGFTGYGDSGADIAGNDSFAAAAWVRLSEQLKDKDAGDEVNVAEQNTLMNSAEIVASIYKDSSWTSTRLTINSAPDMAPAVATNGDKAVVFWRSVVSRLTGDPDANVDENFLNFDDRDCIMYSVYDGNNWSEAQMLYNGANGSVKALEAAMLPDGSAMAVYTLDRSSLETIKEGESGYEIGYTIVDDAGNFGTSMMATSDTYLDENPQVITASFGSNDNRFVLAWHTIRDGMGDIQLLAVKNDGSMSTTFPASLSSLTVSGDATVGGDFRLATLNENATDVSDLTLIWNERITDETDTTGLEVGAHSVIKAAKLLKDGDNYALSMPLEVADLPKNTLTDHFSAYVDEEKQVKAVIQATKYDNENMVDYDKVKVPSEEAMLYTATAAFSSYDMELESITVDYESLDVGTTTPIQFTVRNTGLETITNLKATVADAASETTSLKPGESVTLIVPYAVGNSVANPSYTITGENITDQSGTVYLDYADLGISQMTLLKEEAGKRTVAVTLYNAAAATLADKNREVKLAFYTDSTLTEKANVSCDGFNVDGNTITITGEDNLRRIDQGTFTLVVTFDVGSYVQNTLQATEIPDEGVYLYADAWVDGVVGEQEKPQRMPEAFEADNQSALLLTGAYGRTGHQQVTLQVDQRVDNGKTVAAVTLKNNSLQAFSGGKIAAALVDGEGEGLETKTVDALSASLNGETASTAQVQFEQTGARAIAYFIPPMDDVVLFEGLPISMEKFTKDEATGNFVYTYQCKGADGPSLLVTAYSESGVFIDGQSYDTGGSKSYSIRDLVMQNPDLSKTITVKCGDRTFVLTLLSGDYGTAYSQEPEITRQPQSATYRVDDTAQPLTVEAVSPDGGTLTYQWYGPQPGRFGLVAIPGATQASYTPLTLEAGEFNYYCEVTNMVKDGAVPNYTKSAIAKITVVEKTAEFMITFDPNGGQVDPISAMTENGKLTELPTPTWEGHQFDGWFTAETGGDPVTEDTTFTVDTTIYAHWTTTAPETAETPTITTQPQSANYTVGDTPAALTVEANVTDGGTLSYQWYRNTTNSTTDGTAIPDAVNSSYVPSAEQAGTVYYYCVVTNTNSNATDTKTATATSDAAAITVTEAVSKEYTVTFNANGGTVTPASAQTTDGKLSTLPKPTRSDYTFDGWFTAAEGGEEVTTGTVFTQNSTIYAHWTYAGGSHGGGGSSSGGTNTSTYRITVEPSTNGTVKTSRTTASSGSTITVTVTPDSGYQLDTLTITRANGKDVAWTDKGNGSYTFTMPSSAVSVKATFAEVVSDQLPFADVPEAAWYEDGVRYVYQNDLMTGTSATAFSPDVTTSRAMIATILWRMSGSPVVNYAMNYTDVPEGQWYSEAVRWATSEGVVTGYGNGAFGTNDPITREQFAAMLWRYAQMREYDVSMGEDTNILSYTDVSNVSEYAISAMQWAVGAGIITGTGDGSTLTPKGEASRAQAAVMLMRFCEKYVDKEV